MTHQRTENLSSFFFVKVHQPSETTKETSYRSTTATTIFDILKVKKNQLQSSRSLRIYFQNEYGFHTETTSIETNTVATQVDPIETLNEAIQTDFIIESQSQVNIVNDFFSIGLIDQIDVNQECLTSISNPMSSSSFVSKLDTESETSSYSSISQRKMDRIRSFEKNEDSSSFVLHPSPSFNDNHAKFTGKQTKQRFNLKLIRFYSMIRRVVIGVVTIKFGWTKQCSTSVFRTMAYSRTE